MNARLLPARLSLLLTLAGCLFSFGAAPTAGWGQALPHPHFAPTHAHIPLRVGGAPNQPEKPHHRRHHRHEKHGAGGDHPGAMPQSAHIPIRCYCLASATLPSSGLTTPQSGRDTILAGDSFYVHMILDHAPTDKPFTAYLVVYDCWDRGNADHALEAGDVIAGTKQLESGAVMVGTRQRRVRFLPGETYHRIRVTTKPGQGAIIGIAVVSERDHQSDLGSYADIDVAPAP